ncbi:hypothetical protein BC828DRAFT_375561 [Blastocladiella britannica]|nr:hypothetical protein BC828DRAFT_375561 [Blastocladiella britannica]
MFFRSVPASVQPLLADDIAQNSIGACCVAGAIALIALRPVYKRAFPSHYISDDSPLRYLSHRAQLLFCAALLLLFTSCLVGTEYYLIWTQRTSPFFPSYQILWTTTFTLQGGLIGIASCHRCALLVTQSPRGRTLLLRTITWITVVVMIALWVDAALRLNTCLMADPPFTAYDWWTVKFNSPWTAWLACAFPLFSAAGSVWALRDIMAVSSSGGAAAAAAELPAAGEVISRRSTSAASTAGSAMIGGMSKTDPLPPPRFVSFQRMRSASAASSGRRLVGSGGGSGGTVTYPLSHAFIVLTVLLLIEWFAFLLVNSRASNGRIMNLALCDALSALALATELSFERLAKVFQGRHRVEARILEQTFDMHESMVVQQASPLFNGGSVAIDVARLRTEQRSGVGIL